MIKFTAKDKKIGERIFKKFQQEKKNNPKWLILRFNELYNWNIRKVLKGVALPGWSEHGYPQRQAIDFAPVKGIAKLKDFYKTKEYKWLLKNAKKFGFFLSFPKNNKLGVAFEPWHWHLEK